LVAHGLEYFADIILIRNVGAIRERNVPWPRNSLSAWLRDAAGRPELPLREVACLRQLSPGALCPNADGGGNSGQRKSKKDLPAG